MIRLPKSLGTEDSMNNPVEAFDLASRLRRDADATCMPEYAFLMRRAAEELEDFALLGASAVHRHERQVG